jgi:hypothetical protein
MEALDEVFRHTRGAPASSGGQHGPGRCSEGATAVAAHSSSTMVPVAVATSTGAPAAGAGAPSSESGSSGGSGGRKGKDGSAVAGPQEEEGTLDGAPGRVLEEGPMETGDAWGTTRQNPTEIARRLVQRNGAWLRRPGTADPREVGDDDDGLGCVCSKPLPYARLMLPHARLLFGDESNEESSRSRSACHLMLCL